MPRDFDEDFSDRPSRSGGSRRRDDDDDDYRRPREDIPNYLTQAILCTLCCCMPFGIVAIIFSSQVGTKLAKGDVAGAQAASESAKTWCWVAFSLGIVGNVIGIGLQIMAANIR